MLYDQESQSLVWVEKYRPKTVEDCILPERIKNPFLGFVAAKSFPNLVLTGPAGTGKTTIAKALCNDLNYDVIVINASDERNIDVVRGRITDFASQSSLTGRKKAIILDEADGLNAQSAQPALRAAMEQYSKVRFILTCNYKNKLIPPLLSRASVISFNTKKEERKDTALAFLKRIIEILTTENIKFDKTVLASIVKKFYPDNRRILNELQAYSTVSNNIDVGILGATNNLSTAELVAAFKEKNITAIKQWVVDNLDTEPEQLYRQIYDSFYTQVQVESVPQLIILLGEYQHYSAFVADQEINTMALMMRILGEVDFK